MLAGSAAARHYGYSSARVKSMESQLIDNKTMQEVMNAKDISTILSILFQREFKKDIEEFGGLEIKHELIDFALSKNLAKSVSKLVQISPTNERKWMRAIVGKWDLYNAKLAIEARGNKLSYDKIASQIVDYGIYNATVIKEVMREESIEGMLAKLMINSPYADILKDGAEVYKKGHNVLFAIAEIDKSYYKMLGSTIMGLRVVQNEAARVVKMEIDMKNILFAIKAKRSGFKFQEIGASMISSGNISVSEIEQMYNGSKDIESFVSQIKTYDLKTALDVYKNSRVKQLLTFEIGLKNAIFERSTKLLNHSILSFGAILAYAYMKEIEIYTLRIIINGRLYGLSREEMQRLIVWKNE